MYKDYDIIDHVQLGLVQEDSVPGLVWQNGSGNRRGAIAQVYDAELFNEWVGAEQDWR